MAATLAMTLAGCAGPSDFKFDATNGTDTSWLIRIPLDSSHPERFGVLRLDPGGHGWAGWLGPRDVSIELLDQGCQVVGVFTSTDGSAYSVTGVEGLSATITTWESRDGIGDNDFIPTDQCGS